MIWVTPQICNGGIHVTMYCGRATDMPLSMKSCIICVKLIVHMQPVRADCFSMGQQAIQSGTTSGWEREFGDQCYGKDRKCKFKCTAHGSVWGNIATKGCIRATTSTQTPKLMLETKWTSVETHTLSHWQHWAYQAKAPNSQTHACEYCVILQQVGALFWCWHQMSTSPGA